MHRCSLPLVALVFASLSVLAAETKPAETKPVAGTAEAKVDKALAAPKQDVQRFWVTPEFLMYWTKDGPVHDVYVLRTTDGSSPTLGNPTTERLFANNDQDYGMQLGGRLTFGMWVDECQKWGFELGGFALQEKEARWNHHSPLGGTEIVALSFYSTDRTPPGEGRWAWTDPGNAGSVSVESHSQLWGVGASGLYNVKREDNLTLDATFGIRHVDLSEDFAIRGDNTVVILATKDSFEAHNQFYGPKVGAKFSYTAWDRLLVNVEPSLALGANCESLKVRGNLYWPGAFPGATPPGSILAISPMLGDHSKTSFAVIPEIKVGLGCKITRNLSFNANYNFLYVSDVVRPGQQPNRRINATHLPDAGPGLYNPTSLPNDPRLRFKTSDYWAHGLGVNLKIQF